MAAGVERGCFGRLYEVVVLGGVCVVFCTKRITHQKKVGQEHHKEYVVVVFVGVEQGQ